MKIRTKIVSLAIVAILALSGVGYVAYTNLQTVVDVNDELATYSFPKAMLYQSIYLNIQDMKSQQRTLLIDFEKAYLEKQFGDVEEIKGKLDADVKAHDAFETDTDEGAEAAESAEASWTEFKGAYDAWRADAAKFDTIIAEYIKTGDKKLHAEARDMAAGGMRDKVKAAEAPMESLMAASKVEVDNERAQAALAEKSAATAILGGAVVAGGVLIVLAFMVIVSVARPLQRATDYAHKVSEGDLAAEYGQHTKDEVGELTKALETMKGSLVARLDQLREIAGAVIVAAESMGETANEVSAAVGEVKAQATGVPAIGRLEKTAAELVSKSENLLSAAEMVKDRI
jgi:methyl-accepting chemotaxis protein